VRAAYLTVLSVFCGFVLSACGDHSPTTPSGATPCSYSVGLTTNSFAAGGGTGTASVTAGAGCSWSATSGADWVTLSGASQGSGPGSFTYTVAASSAANDRQTTIGVASASATISQTACAITVAPTAITVGNGSEQASVAVTASGACSWNASADATWLSADPGTGHGSSALTLHVAENNTTGARTAHVQVGGATITVSQTGESAGCAFTFSPAGAELEHQAGTGASHGCIWQPLAPTAAQRASTTPMMPTRPDRGPIHGAPRSSSSVGDQESAAPSSSFRIVTWWSRRLRSLLRLAEP